MIHIGNLDELQYNFEMQDFVNYQVDLISKTNNTNGRSKERIKEDTISGISSEYFLIRKFNLKKSSDWRYDLFDDNYKYEVKSAKINENFKYFPIRQDLKYVKMNKDIIDKVFLCCIYPNNDVYLFKILDIDEFLKNVKDSKFNKYKYLAKYLLK
jgi:hypothetical protein